mmetsp:Transcript_8232/g.23635  ORF Transcript_8232/g.23635 Transcript_8232/m.23635 type:complete len:239 (+) Transcript_8232:439-1155(+)
MAKAPSSLISLYDMSSSAKFSFWCCLMPRDTWMAPSLPKLLPRRSSVRRDWLYMMRSEIARAPAMPPTLHHPSFSVSRDGRSYFPTSTRALVPFSPIGLYPSSRIERVSLPLRALASTAIPSSLKLLPPRSSSFRRLHDFRASATLYMPPLPMSFMFRLSSSMLSLPSRKAASDRAPSSVMEFWPRSSDLSLALLSLRASQMAFTPSSPRSLLLRLSFFRELLTLMALARAVAPMVPM